MSERKMWTSEEDKVIQQLVKVHGSNAWTKVAYEMRIASQQLRSSKQIRERWHNYLDPSINKAEWSREEEQILFRSQKQLGCRWKAIANLLHNRTDNAVKNHFYSTIRRALRRMSKYFGLRNSTKEMRTLKPALLSYLVNSSIFVDALLLFNSFKPSKINCLEDDSKVKAQLDSLKIHYQNIVFHVEQSNINRNFGEQLLEKTEQTALKEESVQEESQFEVKFKQNWFDQDQPSIQSYVFADI